MKQLLLLLLIAVLMSCNKEEQYGEKITGYTEYTMTVASKKLQGVVGISAYFLSEVYAVHDITSKKWRPLVYIQEFEYESGYEYVIKISETNYLDYTLGDPAWTEYKLIEIISKKEKDSENLPEHFIPDWFTNK